MDLVPKTSIKAELADLLLAALPINFFCINKDGYLLECNERLVNHSKVASADQILNKHILELATPEAWINCQIAMSENRSITIEETTIEADGSEKIFLSIKSPMHNQEGEVIGVLGLGIDITEKKLAEKRELLAKQQVAEEKIKAQAETELRQAVTILAGSIAHDLRTPLSSLSLLSDLLQQAYQKNYQEYQIFSTELQTNTINFTNTLNTIGTFPAKLKKVMHQMNKFIDITLKTMQKLVAGTLNESDFVECEIAQSVDEVLSRYPFKETEKDLVYVNLNDNFSFLGCPVIFYRIMFNLINNSLQQINEKQYGKIFITSEKKGKINYLKITDTAGGASPEIVAHLFDGYRTTKENGTGIGLPFCKLAMESFGGTITCDFTPGESIEFTLAFPYLEEEKKVAGIGAMVQAA